MFFSGSNEYLNFLLPDFLLPVGEVYHQVIIIFAWTEHLVFGRILKVFGAWDLSRSTRLDEICILARSQPLGRSESRV